MAKATPAQKASRAKFAAMVKSTSTKVGKAAAKKSKP